MRVLFDADTVAGRVKEMSSELAESMATDTIVIGILNGAAPFMMDLLRYLPATHHAELTYDFVDATSYQGTVSSGSVHLSVEPSVDVRDRDVLLVDGIVDTGRTFQAVVTDLTKRGVRTLRTCALLDKPSRREIEVMVDHVGFTIEDLFVVGYGMDVDQRFRCLRHIAVLEPS